MQYQPIGNLLHDADFGRLTALSRPTWLLASNYRYGIWLLVIALLLAHLPIVAAPALLIIVSVIYTIYTILRPRLLSVRSARFSTNRVYFWRAQLGVIAITGLLLILRTTGTIGVLWALYLPALQPASFHQKQRRSLLLTAEALLAVALIELYGDWIHQQPLLTLSNLSAISAVLLMLLIPNFMVHYLARVNLTLKHGIAVRDDIIHNLLQKVMLDVDALVLWSEIGAACERSVNATCTQVYLYNRERRRLMRVEHAETDVKLGAEKRLKRRFLAAQAIRQNDIVEQSDARHETMLAVPVHGPAGAQSDPLAVIVLRIPTRSSYERAMVRLFLTTLLHEIEPIISYASIHQYMALPGRTHNGQVHSLHLHDVLDTVLETLCVNLGFSFATISLVDPTRQEIRTVCGRHVPDEWIADAHHRLDSTDIQATVIRTGKIEVLADWDDRFDRRMWEKYKHAALVRVFVPLGAIGTIEAGFPKQVCETIPDLLIQVLKRYAYDVMVAIQNAQTHEAEQHQAAMLRLLHQMSFGLQTNLQQHDEHSLLERITTATLDVLGASIVTLNLPQRQDPRYPDRRFRIAVLAGEQDGGTPLKPPDGDLNIVRHIAETRQVYYQCDAQADPRLVGDRAYARTHRERQRLPRRSFTERQGISSFAGVPLIARGSLLGVLCVNYRTPQTFPEHSRQLIELLAQQMAALIASTQLVREQERRRLEREIHDWVKTGISGINLLLKASHGCLDANPQLAREHLQDAMRHGQGVLSDVGIILNNLAPDGYDGQALRDLLNVELKPYMQQERSRLLLDIADDLPVLPTKLTRTVLAVVREAVTNADRHARAKHIQVQVRCTNDQLNLTIEDDGIGFQLRAKAGPGHRGLECMHEHIADIHGQLVIETQPGAGARIKATLPHQENCHARVH